MNKSWIANGVTAANAFFGGLSIMMSIEGHYDLAAIFILIAMVADALDGRVARALHTAGPMGVELDSLSDDISFATWAVHQSDQHTSMVRDALKFPAPRLGLSKW